MCEQPALASLYSVCCALGPDGDCGLLGLSPGLAFLSSGRPAQARPAVGLGPDWELVFLCFFLKVLAPGPHRVVKEVTVVEQSHGVCVWGGGWPSCTPTPASSSEDEMLRRLGDAAQQLRASAAPAEDPGSGLSTGRLLTTAGHQTHADTHAHVPHTHTYNTHMHTKHKYN